jgi:hypothetical protein
VWTVVRFGPVLATIAVPHCVHLNAAEFGTQQGRRL